MSVFGVGVLGLVMVVSAAAQVQATANGLVAEGPALTLRVDALRADVLRVRMYPKGQPAEDASWAVLPEARTARVAVTAEASGFRTAALRVTVGADLRLTVADLAGHVLQEDAAPVAWEWGWVSREQGAGGRCAFLWAGG